MILILPLLTARAAAKSEGTCTPWCCAATVLFPPPPGLPLETKMPSLQKTLILIQLLIHPLNLNNTHLNNNSVPSEPLKIGPTLIMAYHLDNPFDSSQRS